MPNKKSCSSSEDYVVATCDSDSISSYYVDASCDYYDTDSCGTIRCDSSRCSSSSKCCCSSSSDCSSCRYCCSNNSSECYDSFREDKRYHNQGQGYGYAPVPTTVTTQFQPVPTTTATVSETQTALPPSSVPAPPNKSFRSVITPIVDLSTPFSVNDGTVAFTMRRRNDVVTLQHEPFSATIARNGANHLAVRQSIGDLPSHPVHFPFVYKLRGEGRVGFIRIDPLDGSANIKFFLDMDDRVTANMGDSFEVEGGSVSWVTSY